MGTLQFDEAELANRKLELDKIAKKIFFFFFLVKENIESCRTFYYFVEIKNLKNELFIYSTKVCQSYSRY